MSMGSYGTGFRDRGSYTDCMALSPLRSAVVRGLLRTPISSKKLNICRQPGVPPGALA